MLEFLVQSHYSDTLHSVMNYLHSNQLVTVSLKALAQSYDSNVTQLVIAILSHVINMNVPYSMATSSTLATLPILPGDMHTYLSQVSIHGNSSNTSAVVMILALVKIIYTNEYTADANSTCSSEHHEQLLQELKKVCTLDGSFNLSEGIGQFIQHNIRTLASSNTSHDSKLKMFITMSIFTILRCENHQHLPLPWDDLMVLARSSLISYFIELLAYFEADLTSKSDVHTIIELVANLVWFLSHKSEFSQELANEIV